ncbi:ATP-binding protein [Nonomuraea aurantiaca]|uniref:ATP-binding protein n=1 Tax=Nonomuraea aurantiaca TaxID=2878562 RepID=UPI001CDA0DA3|nr:ATP-binding protein [Nonomuraea aurantiaca]MCA2222952.1 ATP-binding protein [Nonomuraea aurantiaca]
MISEFRLQWPITRDLATLRECVHAFGFGAGLTGQRLQDLVFVANEAATNVLQHGGAGGALIAWSDDVGVSLEVVDAVGALSEADLSLEPDLAAGHGVGLWLIRRLCDEVSIEGVAGSARLRLRLRRQAPATA